MFQFNKSSGQASRLLLVLAIIVFVAVIIVFLVMRMITPAPPPPGPEPIKVVMPVYDIQLADIKFIFESSRDLGNTLRASSAKGQYTSYLKDMTTTERFIIVTIGAQNKGKVNISDRSWDIGNIIDSEGREFVPVDPYTVSPWIPDDSSCQALLQPEFEPTPCTKIYKVAKISTGLKVTVLTGKDNDPNSFSGGDLETGLLDLIVR